MSRGERQERLANLLDQYRPPALARHPQLLAVELGLM